MVDRVKLGNIKSNSIRIRLVTISLKRHGNDCMDAGAGAVAEHSEAIQLKDGLPRHHEGGSQ